MRLVALYFALSFYALGALVIENDVNYGTWYHLDAAHFGAYHQALESRLTYYLFTPMALQLLVNGLLIGQKLPQVPRWPFIVTFALNGYVVAESLLVQVPIHQTLSAEYSVVLLDRLITYHQWWRLPAELTAGGINCWLLYRCLQRAA